VVPHAWLVDRPDIYLNNVQNSGLRILHGFFPFSFYIAPFYGLHSVKHSRPHQPHTRQDRDRAKQRATTPTPLPRQKRILFGLIIGLLPFLVIGGLELGVRLFGSTSDLSLFTIERVGGRDFYVMNPGLKNRYFSHVEFSPTTSADYFPVVKAAGTFRVFCLGGSTTVGFPYGYAGSFPFLLRQRLERLFPDRNIEVINLGMTATNSFTALDIAEELPAYQPDAVLVYDGHNEFYGALGIASRDAVAQSRWVTRLYLKATHSRLFFALRNAYARLRTENTPGNPASGTMMERMARGQEIALGSPVYNDALEMFRANVQALVVVCRDHNIPVILGTQVSNLRDLPPFISGTAPDTHQETNASAAFAAARHLDSLGQFTKARAMYVRARDLDQLRFRSSSDLNAIIRSEAGPGVGIADCEEAFAAASRDSITGSDLVLEHVHPTERGYALLARTYTQAMRTAGLIAPEAVWVRRDTLDEAALAHDLRLTELDTRAAQHRIAVLTSQWPFTSSPHAVPRAATSDEIGRVVARLTNAEITWEEAHVAAAGVYGQQQDTANLEREYLTLIRVLPANVSAYLLLSDLYLRTGDQAGAARMLQRSLRAETTFAALQALGQLTLQHDGPDSARAYLQLARPLAPNADARIKTDVLIAQSWIRSGDSAAARLLLEQILVQRPGFGPARGMLQRLGGAR
jgi:tetratricopeptide (TPR) repeat protein